jgi:CBS domain-containing protein
MIINLEKAGIDRFQKITKFVSMNPVYCKDSNTIKEAINKILETGHRSFPIVFDKRVVGVITIMDVLSAYLRKQDLNDKISTIMSRDVLYCNATDTVGFVLKKFKLTRRGRFPILDKKKLVGIVTERDYTKHFSNIEFGISVEELMTTKPFFVKPNISILDCLKSMVNTRYRRLPVVLGKKLVGLETVTDILKYLKNNDYNEVSLLEPLEMVMITDVLSISKRSDVSDAIKIMKSRDIGGLPVVDSENILEGFITERDILEYID